MHIVPVLVEVRERDGKSQVVFRPDIEEHAMALHRAIVPGDWMLVVSRVRHVRFGGGFQRVAGGDMRQLRFDGPEWNPALREGPSEQVRWEVELYPDTAETFLLTGKGVLEWT